MASLEWFMRVSGYGSRYLLPRPPGGHREAQPEIVAFMASNDLDCQAGLFGAGRTVWQVFNGDEDAAFVDLNRAAKYKASLPGRQPHEAAAKEKES